MMVSARKTKAVSCPTTDNKPSRRARGILTFWFPEWQWGQELQRAPNTVKRRKATNPGQVMKVG